jgi:hypothetical protein
MAVRLKLFLLLSIIFSYSITASSLINKSDTLNNVQKKPLRVYNTIRLTTKKPVIDGKLDDECWKTGEWAGDYTQWVPNEGAKPSQKTEIKILYDDNNIYVAIRAYDNEPEKISHKSGKRDELVGDMVGVNFDSYHDHRTGFEFDISAGGQKLDCIITNPSASDMNWNAVWYAKTAMEDSAWTAEFEIPLSQLRYSSDSEQVWGMHCWRWIERLQEESDWEPQSSVGPGMLYLFGELHGIKDLPKSRRIEVMPYMLGEAKTFPKEAGNPFANKGRSWKGNAGLDAKIGLSSNFTADLSINPDFGQVESDPSVMNLSAFETFFDEKRPFFLEGKTIFNFDFDNVNLFYSRRIGHTPTYMPDLKDNEYIKYPDNTSILSAVKISGKTASGLSIGALQCITDNEQAKISAGGSDKYVTVEPLTSYSIVRVQQDYLEGNTILGGIITSTNRFINDPQLDYLNRDAYTGGLDLLHQWNDKEFYLNAKFVGSFIKGSRNAIDNLQTSSARYYQRPDADYISLDTLRTQLSGYGGSMKIGKGSKGLWRYSSEINWRSPGLDLNDIGFMQTSDIIKMTNSISYFVNESVSIFRTYNAGISETNNWNFGMDYLSTGVSLSFYLEFLNNWAVSNTTNYTSQALDMRILRGGYGMLVPEIWTDNLYARTDPSKKIYSELNATFSASGDNSSKYFYVQPGISFMPMNILKFSVYVNYSNNHDNLQYIDTKSVNNQNQYILGKINQQTLGVTFRIDYNITPELSLQYYGSPFASVGKYSEFKTVTDPRAKLYTSRYLILNPVLNGNDYNVPGDNNSSMNYSFSNPDFNFYQFRSNLVLRWEYSPGSQIYLVWSQDRTNYIQPGNYSVNTALSNLKNIYPNNIFLLKYNYWFTI